MRARPQPLLGEEGAADSLKRPGCASGGHEDRSPSGQLAREALSAVRRRLAPGGAARGWSWHVASDEGDPSARSLFVDDVCDLFRERLGQERLRRPLGAVEQVSSPSRGLRHRCGERRCRPGVC